MEFETQILPRLYINQFLLNDEVRKQAKISWTNIVGGKINSSDMIGKLIDSILKECI